ncbi:MAG: Mur ligase family protein [Hyphomonas sp.]|nr:Mur ligase family protein [Hyphomonas sp.]
MSILNHLPFFVFVVALAGFGMVRINTVLTYFQQEEYDSSRFLGAVFRVRLFDVLATLGLIGLLIMQAVVGLGVYFWLAAAALLAGLALRERGYSFKKKLVVTQRLKRIRWLSRGFFLLSLVLLWIHPYSVFIILQAVPLWIMLANRLLRPFQEKVNQGFIDQAVDKLKRFEPVTIGITGSFGKTTTKHIFAEVLESAGPVFYSPGSINTVLGLTRNIREKLQRGHKYFIAEMGAYGIGSIKRLCDFADPGYGIVTAIGNAHTERFGDIATIAKAKSELIEHVCARGGMAVYPHEILEHKPFADLQSQYPDLIRTVGETEAADFQIIHAELEDSNWSIALQNNRTPNEPPITYTLPLLGDHNILNSALAVAMTYLISPVTATRIPAFSKDVEQVQHRLQKVEAPGQPLVLDDAYNSNEVGFKNAVTVLNKLAKQRGGKAILVTPGVAEMGLEHDRVHGRLGEHASTLCDTIIAVNPDRIDAFTAALDTSKVAYHARNSFAEARKLVSEISNENDVVLYENDLPDLLEETRLL